MVRPRIGADGEMPSMKLGLISKDLCHCGHRFFMRPNVSQSYRFPTDDLFWWTEKVVAVKSELSTVQLPQKCNIRRLPQVSHLKYHLLVSLEGRNEYETEIACFSLLDLLIIKGHVCLVKFGGYLTRTVSASERRLRQPFEGKLTPSN